jgi:GNAT superfamily N-acetyltransferase
MSSFKIRKATAADRDFLIKVILEADKSNTQTSSYARLLNMQEAELKLLFENIFEEELEGCEFGQESFNVLMDGDNYAAASASWIEGADGLPSWQIKTSALFCVLTKDNFENLKQNLETFSSINIPRSNGTLQIESVFVEEAYRGKGLFSELLNFQIIQAKEAGFDFNTLELVTYNSNQIAERAYTKAGFVKVKSTQSENSNILNYYPGTGMNLWQKTI